MQLLKINVLELFLLSGRHGPHQAAAGGHPQRAANARHGRAAGGGRRGGARRRKLMFFKSFAVKLSGNF